MDDEMAADNTDNADKLRVLEAIPANVEPPRRPVGASRRSRRPGKNDADCGIFADCTRPCDVRLSWIRV